MLQLLRVLILGHEEHLVVGIERGIACPNRSRCEMLHLRAILSISHFFHLGHGLGVCYLNLIYVVFQVEDVSCDFTRLDVTRCHRLVVEGLRVEIDGLMLVHCSVSTLSYAESRDVVRLGALTWTCNGMVVCWILPV